MRVSIATVSTKNARRYLRELCRHWGSHFTVIFNDHRGTVDFGDAQIVELAATENLLEITILDGQGTRLPELEKIVVEQLECFSYKEQLNFEWISR